MVKLVKQALETCNCSTRGFFADCFVLIFQQLMSLRSDAPFRDAKNKLLEIRSQQSKRLEQRMEMKDERRERKRQKK